jgi:hypothetical protein
MSSSALSMVRLVAIPFLTATLIGGCSVTEVERDDLAAVVERDAITYAPGSLSEEAVEMFASNQVVLIGETHWIREHREFVADIVQDLHPKGFRQILLEFPQAAEWLIDDYMQGGLLEPDWIPPIGLNGDLIEAIRAFNRSLPESEWVRVRGIDVMLDEYGGSDGFDWSISRISRHLGDPEPLSNFAASQNGNANQRKQSLELLADDLQTQHSALRQAWGDYWYGFLSEMVEIEQSTENIRAWRADRYDDSARLREDVMKDLAERRLRDFGYKTLINVGGNHAQKARMLGTDQEWLGDFLVHKSTATGGSVITVNVRPARIITEDESRVVWDVADSSPPNELWRVMRESFPNRMIQLSLDDSIFSDETILMNYEDVIYETSPKDIYDVLVSLPVVHQLPH